MILEYFIQFMAIYLLILFLLKYTEDREKIIDPEPTRFPEVSIIVPAYNEEKTLEKKPVFAKKPSIKKRIQTDAIQEEKVYSHLKEVTRPKKEPMRQPVPDKLLKEQEPGKSIIPSKKPAIEGKTKKEPLSEKAISPDKKSAEKI